MQFGFVVCVLVAGVGKSATATRGPSRTTEQRSKLVTRNKAKRNERRRASKTSVRALAMQEKTFVTTTKRDDRKCEFSLSERAPPEEDSDSSATLKYAAAAKQDRRRSALKRSSQGKATHRKLLHERRGCVHCCATQFPPPTATAGFSLADQTPMDDGE